MKRIISLLLSILLLLLTITPVFSANTMTFSIYETNGETVFYRGYTYTVFISLSEASQNVAAGSLMFRLNDGLQYIDSGFVSSYEDKFDGSFSPVIAGENIGSYAYVLLSTTNIKFKSGPLCYITFKVNDDAPNQTNIKFFGYDLYNINLEKQETNQANFILTVENYHVEENPQEQQGQEQKEPQQPEHQSEQTQDPTEGKTPATQSDIDHSIIINDYDTIAEIPDEQLEDNPVEDMLPSILYTDVPEKHWAYTYISHLSQKGIVSGVGNGVFMPDRVVTRAEFIKMLSGLAGADVADYKTGIFNDVNSNDWFMPYVAWAVENGITTGTSDDTFSPQKPVTREQAATLIFRLCEKYEISLDQTNPYEEFIDKDEISSYAQLAVMRMQVAGILKGTGNGMFNPKGSTTRAAAAKMISMLIENK